MFKSYHVVTVGAASLLAACSVGPDYERPSMDIPATFKEASGCAWKVATPDNLPGQERWWTLFNDDVLNALEEQATQSSPKIAVALAQYEQAMAVIDQAKAGFFPTLALSASDTKTATKTPASASTSSKTSAKNEAPITAQATWEIDLWGQVRRLVEEDEALAASDAALLAGVKLSTQSTLAQAYFQLRALDEAQDAYDAIVAAYTKFLTVTQNQYRAGVASQLAVQEAKAQLKAIEVLTLDNGVIRAQLEHAIAVLVNEFPAHFSIKKRKTELTPPKVPLSVPSTLLERRPDIASAERLMAAANAQRGVATAAYFPSVTLSGTHTSYLTLLSAPVVVWALGAQVTQTLFDGGARAATLEAADAGYRQAVATYRQTVLAAFQNVEDNLSTLRILNEERAGQEGVLTAAEKELTFIKNQYSAGTVSSLEVMGALYTTYNARIATVTLASRQMSASVALITSLGGMPS